MAEKRDPSLSDLKKYSDKPVSGLLDLDCILLIFEDFLILKITLKINFFLIDTVLAMI